MLLYAMMHLTILSNECVFALLSNFTSFCNWMAKWEIKIEKTEENEKLNKPKKKKSF